MVDYLRIARIPKTSVPLRYVTRPLRANESLEENRHVTLEEFEHQQRNGSMVFSWQRPMSGNEVIHYGFAATTDDTFAIYSGNNSLFANPDSISSSQLLHQSLWVGVLAPLATRKDRMQKRSPDLSTQEREYRLRDTGEEMRRNVHLLAHNVDQSPDLLGRTLCSLVAGLVRRARPAQSK